MDNDMKWVVILVVAFIGIPLIGLALSDYNQSQCRLEAIKVSMPADDITKVCGK
jgi:uncharacterized oligopeptide transporter (OPT) family protein